MQCAPTNHLYYNSIQLTTVLSPIQLCVENHKHTIYNTTPECTIYYQIHGLLITVLVEGPPHQLPAV